MQTRHNPQDSSSVSVVPADYADAKHIFLVGLLTCGQQKLKKDLLAAPLITAASQYKATKTKKSNTIKVVEFSDDTADEVISQVTSLDLEKYDASLPTLVVFCLDTSKSISLQQAMVETSITLLNNRRFSGDYAFIYDIAHPGQHASLPLKALGSLVDLEHANFLSDNRILMVERFELYSKPFNRLNNIINDLVIALLKRSTYAKVGKYLGPVEIELEFTRFVETYRRDFENSGLFKRSRFADALASKTITNMDQVRQYAAKHPASRTSFLLKCHPERPTDIKLVRFLNRYEHDFLKAGFFKRSNFKKSVAKGEVRTFDDVNVYADAHPGSRAAAVLRTFKRK